MQDRLFLTHQNAVINKEGENERIDHWVNKNWNIRGDFHAPMEDKLIFLYEIGRRKQVGMYLRNQNILDKLFQAMYKKRAECEKIHGHIKHCLLYTSDAADEEDSVDLGGRRIIKKKKKKKNKT